jgi:hypothetical protein
MSFMTQLASLGAAAVIASSAPQVRIDLKAPGKVQRIDEIWMVTYVNEADVEVLVQGQLSTGEFVPMIAADRARMESMVPAARAMAKALNIQMRLIKYTNRVDLLEIRP